MVSREFIHSVVRADHVIAVHMKGEERINNLSIYITHDLILDEVEEKQLIINSINCINTNGLMRIKAVRTHQIDLSIQDSESQNYTINTLDIIKYETVNMQNLT